MGYNEEQTISYNSLMYAWGVFEEMKQVLKKEKCPIHKKALKLGASWERAYELDITVYKYCCIDFASKIAKVFEEKQLFTSVSISKQ